MKRSYFTEVILVTVAAALAVCPSALAQDGVLGSLDREAAIAPAPAKEAHEVPPTSGEAVSQGSGQGAGLPGVSEVKKYTVLEGDNLWDLALRFGTTPLDLKFLNGISGNAIFPGQVLSVPVPAGAFTKKDDMGSFAELVKLSFRGHTLIAHNPSGALLKPAFTGSAEGQSEAAPDFLALSPRAIDQMKRVVAYAKNNNSGASRGRCFNYVWKFLSSSGYGNIKSWGDLSDMPSGEARNFAEFMNRTPRNLERAGLKRIDNISPPITNPHDPRVPVGAVIVVSAGSYGTRHATAGDIAISAGNGRFLNDGPNMDYGTRTSWYGKVLGIYVPK